MPQHARQPRLALDLQRCIRWRVHRESHLTRSSVPNARVRPLGVVVGDVLVDEVIEVPLAHHDELLQALHLNALDDPFHVRVEVR